MAHRNARWLVGKRKLPALHRPFEKFPANNASKVQINLADAGRAVKFRKTAEELHAEPSSSNAVQSPVRLHENWRQMEEARKVSQLSPFVIEDLEACLLGFSVFLRNLKLQVIAIERSVILDGGVQLDVA
jgi:hypothetical protein